MEPFGIVAETQPAKEFDGVEVEADQRRQYAEKR